MTPACSWRRCAVPDALLTFSGLVAREDLPPHDAPPEVWTLARDVQFRQGIAQRVNGWKSYLGTASGDPLHVRNSFFGGTTLWYYLTAAAIYRVNAAGTHTNITGTWSFSGKVPNDITSCELNGLPVFNVGVDAPVYHDRSTGNVADLPDWPTGAYCQAMRAFKNYLIALDYYDGSSRIPSLVKWSDAAEPGTVPDDGAGTTWSAAAANDSGDLSLGGATEGLVDGHALRDVFMCSKPHSLWQLLYVGGTAIFGSRQLSATVGALARNCMAEVNGTLVILADGDIIQTDGQQIRSIADRAVRRKIFADIDPTNFEQAFVVHHKLQKEVWVCYPANGASVATNAAVYCYETGKWSFRNLSVGGSGCPHADVGNVSIASASDTWDSDSNSWNSDTTYWDEALSDTPNDGLIGIDYDTPGLALLDSVVEPAAGAVNALLRRESLDMGRPDIWKLIQSVRLRVTGEAGDVLQVRVGSQDNPEQAIDWSDYRNWVIGSTERIVFSKRARYVSIEVIADSARIFRLSGFTVNYREAGRFG